MAAMTDDLRTRKTVGELIAELSAFPADMPVMVYDFQRLDEWIPDPVVKVAQVQIVEYRGRTSYVYPNENRAAHTTEIVSIDLS
jgi:hypothetical protein